MSPDPRLIVHIRDNPGWKVLRHHLQQRLSETEQIMLSANLNDEASRMRFARNQGYRDALLEVMDLPEHPNKMV